MKRIIFITAMVIAGATAAFDSVGWLAMRDNTLDRDRLRKAYAKCLKSDVAPAVDLVVPIETYDNGTVKSVLRVHNAWLFPDSGLLMGEGVFVQQYKPDGKTLEGSVWAENCLVDRKTRTGWVEGKAEVTYGTSNVQGHGVYFDFVREYVSVMDNAQIMIRDVKMKELGK